MFLSAVSKRGGHGATRSHRGVTAMQELSGAAEPAAFCCYWYLVPYNYSLNGAVNLEQERPECIQLMLLFREKC